MHITSTEEYAKVFSIEIRGAELSFEIVDEVYHYQIQVNASSPKPHKLFHYLNGISIETEERIKLTFESSLESRTNSTPIIRFTCSHKVKDIQFNILQIFESPQDYSIDLEAIDFGRQSTTFITSENSVQPFLGLIGMKEINYENGAFSFNILPA